MFCPQCGHDGTKVLDSRSDGNERTRRRRCIQCGFAFGTIERVSAENLLVRKRDGRTEPFSRAKLTKGISKAVSGNSITTADINAFVDRVMRTLQPTAPGVPIPSIEIGRLVLQQLYDSKSITDVARIRYAIVFLSTSLNGHSLNGLQEFLDWLRDAYGSPNIQGPIETPSRVVKRDGRAEPFELAKIIRSIDIVTKDRNDRGADRLSGSSVAQQVRHELRGQAIVTSQQIAAEILKILCRRDALAYLRYASVNKYYKSVNDFWLEVAGLQGKVG
jgi:transcriptional repressor NrdR